MTGQRKSLSVTFKIMMTYLINKDDLFQLNVDFIEGAQKYSCYHVVLCSCDLFILILLFGQTMATNRPDDLTVSSNSDYDKEKLRTRFSSGRFLVSPAGFIKVLEIVSVFDFPILFVFSYKKFLLTILYFL